jgi:hypothetical protein
LTWTNTGSSGSNRVRKPRASRPGNNRRPTSSLYNRRPSTNNSINPSTQAPPQYYQPAPAYGQVPGISSYMGWAIATLILCFWPTGIVAVVHASRVGNRLALGDYAGAQESSHKAKVWCWVTFGIGIAWIVIAVILWVVAAAAVITVY